MNRYIGVLAVVALSRAIADGAWVEGAKGVVVGMAGGLAGGLIAGAIGLVTVPLIAIAFGLPVPVAAATNLFQTIFTAGSGALAHAGKGHAHPRLAGTLLVGAVVGAPLGAWLSLRTPDVWLRWLFVVLLLGMAGQLVRRMSGPSERRMGAWLAKRLEGSQHAITGTFQGQTWSVAPVLAVGLGAAIGLASGLLGIGGGFLFTPLVAMVLHVPTRLALGTGLLAIAGNSLFATVPHLLAGTVWFTVGLALAVGGSLGATWGSALSHRLPERGILGLFVVMLVLVAWQMAPV